MYVHRTVAIAALAIATAPLSAQTLRERFTPRGSTATEEPTTTTRTFTEAPAGFDNVTNGYLQQGPDFDTIAESTVVPGRSFNDDRFIFEEVENREEGLGPVYNGQSCAECHQNVATGGASQVAEHRTGRLENGQFFESLGGSLLHSRATWPELVEHVVDGDNVRTFRISTNTLGDGFVEAVSNLELLRIRGAQPSALRGTVVVAPVLEASSKARIGRFGWKSQHASLVSFAADAYVNEMGITTPLLPNENTSSGKNVGWGTDYDPKADPEDDGTDVSAFADFMRSTKAPSRGEITSDVLSGETIFKSIGCAVCHTDTLHTVPPGTSINGGNYVVPDAIGNKVFHPYSDFLLHDVGTGDGIPVSPDLPATANKVRTAPLWGLRTRNRLMHDGLTFTNNEAILRHAGQAKGVTSKYKGLSAADRASLLAFLDTL